MWLEKADILGREYALDAYVAVAVVGITESVDTYSTACRGMDEAYCACYGVYVGYDADMPYCFAGFTTAEKNQVARLGVIAAHIVTLSVLAFG